MEELEGYVESIVFRNADNGYTVFEFVADETLTTCVGVFPVINEGENFKIRGEYTNHPTYGKQFKVASAEPCEPTDAAAMERYLGSGAIKGIGVKLASRIVRKFGEDTFRIIEEEPERLAEVKGISLAKAMEISDQIVSTRDIRNAMIYLDKYGIHGNIAIKIFGQYGNEIYSILKSNPYRLADEVSGIGFKMADEIASRIGIDVDSEFRVKSGIVYTLTQAASAGHTYLPMETLSKTSANLLGVSMEVIEPQVMNLLMDRRIIVKQDSDGEKQVYNRSFYHMEEAVAGMLVDLDVEYKADAGLEDAISQIENEEKLKLDDLQKKAVMQAATHGFFVMTGGPGTGKTTTIKAMIKLFENKGLDIFLAAPTGRAAKRMSEATGYEAKTIHRMLEVVGRMADGEETSTGFAKFDRNEENPLETDVIIIDEMSMVDISLMYSLLKAVAVGTRLILVGDVHQLPSVGAGNVLRDILNSGRFPSLTLERIFRQAEESDIVVNAHKIHKGEHVELDNQSKDFFFLQRDNSDAIISVILTLVQQKMPKYVQADMREIQVLTPTRKGLYGVERLNTILQRYLNPPEPSKKEWTGDTRIFRQGDKVMQIKNNYQLEWTVEGKYGIVIDKGMGVFNGDVGVISEINEWSKTIEVTFDEGRKVEYPYALLDELELAYAITIHKSQGSEYPAVVMPIMSGPAMLMNRNILYTAITRAKKCVCMVGDPEVFYQMCENTSQAKRYSGLCQRIMEK